MAQCGAGSVGSARNAKAKPAGLRCGMLLRVKAAFGGVVALLTSVFGLSAISPHAAKAYDPSEMVFNYRRPFANAYCSVPTFSVLNLQGQARALLETEDEPLILIDLEMTKRPAYARFLLAHECCHHTRGHLAWLRKQQNKSTLAWQADHAAKQQDPQDMLTAQASSTSHRKIELDADCCAARLLALRGDKVGLKAAIEAMMKFGSQSTGPDYPAGVQRAAIIGRCSKLR